MRKVIFQISTHWDREWYLPFQGFRYYLVELLDAVTDALEKETIPEFVLDGQTIVLEDYLEIRPENRERLWTLIKQGKLKIGPWYCMPDELSVSGESIIENFLVGHNVAQAFRGEAWKFGYINDIFGHIAQMPQILNGFGINGAYLGRGVDSSYPNDTHFLWRGIDGSECYCYKDNYGSFRRPYSTVGDRRQYLRDKLSKGNPEYPLVLNFTDDHAPLDKYVFEVLEFLKDEDVEVEFGFENISNVMSDRKDELPIIKGELVSTAKTINDLRAVTGSISSYYPLKQRNDRVENRLYRETAPLLVMSEMQGILTGKRPFFDTARKYLLKNQPHDSICGCSVDKVHDNMPYRYAQAEAIADILSYEYMMSSLRGFAELKDESFSVYVTNTDIHSRNGVIEINIDFPKKWSKVFFDNTWYQKYNLFKITDKNGNDIPYQILSIKGNQPLNFRQTTICTDRYTVAVDAELCAFGTTEFTVSPIERRNGIPPCAPRGILKAENEYLRVSLSHKDGLTVEEKASGKTYRNLLRFVDDADSGNGWFYGDVGADSPCVSSEGCHTRIEAIHNGPLVYSFRVTKTMSIPEGINIHEYCRSSHYVDMTVVTDIILRKGERHIECHTVVNNIAKEHRLRMLIPTDINGDTYSTSQAFCFLTRNRGASPEGYNNREEEFTEKNTSGIINVADRVAFVGKEGFHEGGVYPDGTISVTMFRSVSKNFQEPRSVSALLLKDMSFEYSIAFGCTDTELASIQQNMQVTPIAFSAAERLTEHEGSLMELTEKNIFVSTVKPAEGYDGWVVRMYNPTEKRMTCDLNTYIPLKMTEVTLGERECAQTDGKGMTFEPYEIKTVILNK